MAKTSTSNPPLRAVTDNEAPPQRKPPSTVAEAAKNGTQRELLVAMRDRIAETVSKPDCPPRELAALTTRLQNIVKDIEVIDAREDSGNRVRDLEDALREVAPQHPLISDVAGNAFDASAI